MRKIESARTGANDKPIDQVEIADSGDLPVDKPFEVEKEAVRE